MGDLHRGLTAIVASLVSLVMDPPHAERAESSLFCRELLADPRLVELIERGASAGRPGEVGGRRRARLGDGRRLVPLRDASHDASPEASPGGKSCSQKNTSGSSPSISAFSSSMSRRASSTLSKSTASRSLFSLM